MRFLELEIRNFLTVGKIGIKLSLDKRGLILVSGRNEDDTSANSNGAGKSTIVEALLWCLFDKTSRGETGDSIVNNMTGKDCFVSILIQDEDIIYRISRYRKHKTCKNSILVRMWHSKSDYDQLLTPTVLDKTGSGNPTEAVIEGIMGCSYDVFMASIYASQEDIVNLPKMTDKELKTIVEKVAGTDRLEKAHMIAKADFNKLDAELASHHARIRFDQERLDDTVSSLKVSEDLFKTYEDTRKDRAAQYEITVKLIKPKLIQKANELKGLKPQAELESEAGNIDESIETNKADRKTVDFKKKEQDEIWSRLIKSKTVVDMLEKDCQAISLKITNAHTIMDGNCSECGKPHTQDDIDAFKKIAQTQYDAKKKELDSAKVIMEDIQVQLDRSTKSNQALLDAIPDISDLIARKDAISDELIKIAALKSEIRSLKKDLDTASQNYNEVFSCPNPHEVVLSMMQTKKIISEADLEKLKREEVSLETNVNIAQDVVSVFGQSGVRAHVLDTITPYLNEQTAYYLTALSDGNMSAVWSTLTTTAKGELREKFNIEVTSQTGGDKFGLISGGEKRKAMLSTMLALQDCSAMRATKPIDLWIGDEIDDSLDPAGLERLMGVLEIKARERGTVLIISHNDLKDWCDQVITVVKKNKESTIEGAI